MRHLRLPTVLTGADAPTAIFGAWDGCISVLAVVVAVAVAGHTSDAAVIGVAGAFGGTFSMATGQYESDVLPAGRLRRALVMGVATGVGGALPVLPFIIGLTRWEAVILSMAFAFALATVVAIVKAHVGGHNLAPGDFGMAYGLLSVTAAVTYAVGAV